jgi:hypothetical protein
VILLASRYHLRDVDRSSCPLFHRLVELALHQERQERHPDLAVVGHVMKDDHLLPPWVGVDPGCQSAAPSAGDDLCGSEYFYPQRRRGHFPEDDLASIRRQRVAFPHEPHVRHHVHH